MVRGAKASPELPGLRCVGVAAAAWPPGIKGCALAYSFGVVEWGCPRHGVKSYLGGEFNCLQDVRVSQRIITVSGSGMMQINIEGDLFCSFPTHY